MHNILVAKIEVCNLHHAYQAPNHGRPSYVSFGYQSTRIATVKYVRGTSMFGMSFVYVILKVD